MGSLVAYDILTRPSTMRRASVSLGSSLPQLDMKGHVAGMSRRRSSKSVSLSVSTLSILVSQFCIVFASYSNSHYADTRFSLTKFLAI